MSTVNDWTVNYGAAKASGLIDLWPDPSSLGVVQDPQTMNMRLVAGSPAQVTRIRMGLPPGEPGDGYLWDIFNCLEDLERAEVGLGLVQASLRERLAAVAKEIERNG